MKMGIKVVIIFIVLFGIFYLIFSGRFTLFVDLILPRPETSQELTQELEKRYHGISPFWLQRYGVAVRKEADIHVDADADGLTLIEEYKYFTHPFEADTDLDGFSDGMEVRNGYSPTGKGRLDINNNNLPDHWEQKYNLFGEESFASSDTDNDGLVNDKEFLYGTNPRKSDTDGDGYTDGSEVSAGYDPGVAGDGRIAYHIMIDKINIDAPIILSKDATEKVLQKDLERGVIHYPGMSLPGKRGNSYIAGHSSNYSWAAGNFNTIFKDLVQVERGDYITITEKLASGHEVMHRYFVTLQEEVAADDARIFADSQSALLTLTTCWPLGTAEKRIMIKAHLVDTEENFVYNDTQTKVAGRDFLK